MTYANGTKYKISIITCCQTRPDTALIQRSFA